MIIIRSSEIPSLIECIKQTRTSTDPEDVQQMAEHMMEKNRQAGQDVDRIFMQRKQRENEIGQVGFRTVAALYDRHLTW